jgi:hypothetical protein
MSRQPRRTCWIDGEPCPLGDVTAPGCIYELTCRDNPRPAAKPVRPGGLLGRLFRKDKRQAHKRDPRQGGPL